MLFYRNLLTAALDLAPNATMRAICDVVKSFQMPGHTIENFTRKSVQIAMAGIYDLRIHHDEVLTALDGAASRFVAKQEATRARVRSRA
jgi:acyl-[acyl-carrier-protein] desaturase